MKKRILSLLIIFSLLSVCFIQFGCDKDTKAIRGYIKDALAATQGIVSAIQTQMPVDDPRRIKLNQFYEALKRFDEAFQIEGTSTATILLFADIITASRDAILPLTALGGTIAIGIVAVDTALRFLANRITQQISENKQKIKMLSSEMQTAINHCDKVLIDYLKTQPVQAE